ncbi:MAG: phosphatase PAP2 family protein [Acidobacteriota bacterium]
MRTALPETTFDRISQLELPVCRFCHELSGTWLRGFFSAVSRVGDGHYLYLTLAGLLLLHGGSALPAIGHTLLVAGVCHALYRLLKNSTARVRPLEFADGTFQMTVAPLDKYSFPSGHTLHAVSFAVLVTAYFPALGWVLIPFALLVAMSRVVLGLHYPTDVVAGAALGLTLALLSFQI